MDEDEWMEPYAVPVDDDWEGGGSGESTPGKEEAEAENRAVEQYWEERGRSASPSPSVATVVLERDVLDYEGGAGTEDAGMEEVEADELDEEEERHKSWSEELRAKKRRTEGGRSEELQKVRDLGRVRQAAFDKKK